MRLVLRLLKGIYDVLASYLLAWVLLFAFVGWLLYLLVGLLLPFWGFQTHEGLWLWCDRAFPLPSWLLRLLLFGAIHVGLYFSLRRPIRGLRRRAGRRIDAWLDRYRAWAKRRRRVATTLGVSFSLLVTLLLVPFVVQPTMVPARFSARDWALRLANLVDGSASAALIESVIGFYRRFGARPTLGESVSPEAFDRAIAGRSVPRASGAGQALMDRWDARVKAVVLAARGSGSVGRLTVAHDFASLKAVMWVESAGEQFAVSHTGCIGLMQFCSRTARTGGFRRIFGVGQVYPCRCEGRCRVSRATRRALESGAVADVIKAEGHFPCDLTDARFDPDKALRAGWLYIRTLRRQFGGDLLLAYVGYNSGPAVARRVYRALGSRRLAPGETPTVARIAPHLAAAMRPYYGESGAGRARGLIKVHLPKLLNAYLTYRERYLKADKAATRPRPGS